MIADMEPGSAPCDAPGHPRRRMPDHLPGKRPALASLGALALVALLALFAACAPAAGSAGPTASPTAQGTSTPLPPPQLLYQADWSQGLTAWQPTDGWTLVNGAPRSDTGADRSLTVPYLPALSGYKVEFTIQILDIPRTGGQFSLQTAASGHDAGLNVGVFGLRAGSFRPNGDHPTIYSYLNPLDAQDPTTTAGDVHDFEPGSGPRTYQATVQGNAVSLAVDGHFFGSAASTTSAQLAHTPLQIICSGVALRVVALRIFSL